MRLLILAAALAAVAAAEETRLRLDTKNWNLVLVEAPLQPEILRAGIGDCDGVPCMWLGPWRAGKWAARYEYTQPVPIVTGAIRGRYRTDGLFPKQAVVRVQWYKGTSALTNRSYSLATAADWDAFEVPLVRPPAGADSIRIGFGLGEKTEGTVWFADLRIVEQAPLLEYSGDPELTRPAPPKDLPGSRYTRVEQHGGAWWLIDSTGKPFFSLGTVPMSLGSPTADFRQERQTLEAMRSLGLDSIAGGSSISRWSAFNDALVKEGVQPLHQFRNIEMKVGDGYDTLVDAAGRNPGASQAQAAATGGFNHAFADPFDPRWEADVRKQVRDIAGRVRNKTYYAGWFAANERQHRDIHRYVYSPNCAAAFRAWLERKYGGSIDSLNKMWNEEQRYSSFEEIFEKKPDPEIRYGPMYEDFRAFSREIIRKANETMIRVIRQEDPGRLIISNRFMVGEQGDVFENLDLYADFDIIAVNIYPRNLVAGLNRDEREFLETVHRRTGKPVIIGEWSVPALDSGLYDNLQKLDWSYPQTVGTQSERAAQAARILADLYNLPFIVGAHWFTWKDIDSSARQANRGLFKANGEPWTELQDAMRRLTSAIASRN
jgi:hypothetical protein